MSSEGINATVPVPASSFVDEIGGGGGGQTEVSIASFGLDTVNSALTLEWDSNTGATFQVWKRESINDNWVSLVTDNPDGGATEATTSYTDMSASAVTSFYQVQIVDGGTGGGCNVIFFDDFEGADMGWTATNFRSGGNWEFGAAAGNGPAAAFSGTNMWGTDLNADAPVGTSTALYSPDIDLTEVTAGRLTFRIWSDTSGDITVDAYNAETNQFFLADFLLTFSGTSPGWFEVVVTLPDTGDLDAGAGEDQGVFGKVVYFEFGLGVTAPTVTAAPGVFIDDVRVIQTN